MTQTPDDIRFMQRALALAQQGRGLVSPNPMVGAVIVRDGRIVAEGYHQRLGQAHAEIEALQALQNNMAAGATMYVTLEPCSHTGEGKRTPPCVPAIIASGLRRIVIAAQDPNPRVAGRGSAALREAKITVESGVLEAEARALNAPYFSMMERGRPWLTAKWAMSLDGKIATAAGDSRWISCEQSRELVHRERAASDAVMVGVGTALADDPMLTARVSHGKVLQGQVPHARQPLRVVLDRELRLPPQSRLAQSAREHPVLLYAATMPPADHPLLCAGVEVACPGLAPDGHLDWQGVLNDLGRRKLCRILLEGGAGVLAGAFASGVVDDVWVFIAPRIVGGGGALSAVGELGVKAITDALELERLEVESVGSDLLVRARVRPRASGAIPQDSRQ